MGISNFKNKGSWRSVTKPKIWKTWKTRFWEFQSVKIGFDECHVKQNNIISIREVPFKNMFSKIDPTKCNKWKPRPPQMPNPIFSSFAIKCSGCCTLGKSSTLPPADEEQPDSEEPWKIDEACNALSTPFLTSLPVRTCTGSSHVAYWDGEAVPTLGQTPLTVICS